MTRKLSDLEKKLLEKDLNDTLSIKNEKYDTQIKIEVPYAEHAEEDYLNAESKIKFSRSGISHKEMKKLEKGTDIKEVIDLHGARANEATEKITSFIEQCLTKEEYKIRIIHGKGNKAYTKKEAVIKNITNKTLQKIPQVLAFCSAKQYDGGTGALNILLKSKRR